MPRCCPSCLKTVPSTSADAQTTATSAEGSPVRCPFCGTDLNLDDPTIMAGMSGISIDGSLSGTKASDPLRGDEVETVDSGSAVSDDATIAHFQLHELLGRGGFGTVWLARDLNLGRDVALKLPKSYRKDAKLLHEAKTAAKLKHPNIVSVFEVGVYEDQVYIASELIDGHSLREQMNSGRLEIDAAVTLLATVARAVAYANQQGVVHRDLKPENIMLDDRGTPFVTDFGIAKQVSDRETISSDGQVLGTVAYMSPEQARGNTRDTVPRSRRAASRAICGFGPSNKNHREIEPHCVSGPQPSPIPFRPTHPDSL